MYVFTYIVLGIGGFGRKVLRHLDSDFMVTNNQPTICALSIFHKESRQNIKRDICRHLAVNPMDTIGFTQENLFTNTKKSDPYKFWFRPLFFRFSVLQGIFFWSKRSSLRNTLHLSVFFHQGWPGRDGQFGGTQWEIHGKRSESSLLCVLNQK